MSALGVAARGIAGGLVFSLPLLYTMEVWWLGFELQPLRLLDGIAATFALLLGYNYSSMRLRAARMAVRARGGISCGVKSKSKVVHHSSLSSRRTPISGSRP